MQSVFLMNGTDRKLLICSKIEFKFDIKKAVIAK